MPVAAHRVGEIWDPAPLLTQEALTDPNHNFEVLPFDPAQHVAMLQHWAAGWDGIAIQPDLLPKRGFVIEDLVALFLYRTDSPVAYLDGIITNPASNEAERSAAIDLVVGAAFDAARADGYRVLIAVTPRMAIVERARRLGFTVAAEPRTTIRRDVNAPYYPPRR